jgi:nucleoside-diphosphate-sugar epimerase
MRDRRILVTGATGQIAFPLAAELAKTNEVWGTARFSDPSKRETWNTGKFIRPATRQQLEDAGIHTARLDLENPDFSELPETFDHVMHLAVFQQLGHDYDYALKINAEGTALLMSQYRTAKSFLVLSTIGVYGPPEDGEGTSSTPIRETDPLGVSASPHSPTYPVSKIAQEAVARSMARVLNLPTTIARMGLSYGGNGGLPAYQLDMMVNGETLAVAGGSAPTNPIHERDIADQATKLLEVATVPATIVNWTGDEVVEMSDYLNYLGELVGITPDIQFIPGAVPARLLDNSKRQALVGSTKVSWRDGMREMAEARHPDRVAASSPKQ